MHPPKIPDYTLTEFIGEGSTGSVWLATYQGQPPMAVKAFKGLAINRQLLSNALVKVYDGAAHPGIIKIHDFDLASPQAYVTMDLCAEQVQLADGRSVLRPRTLEPLCGALPAEAAWRIAAQIADAIAFLHRKRIIHADLKPSNVLFDEGESPRAMVSDFCQGMLGGIEQIEPGDSVFYAPPEQLRDPDHFFEGRAECWDVYRFGATVYRLLTGQFPRLDAAITELRRDGSRELNVRQQIDPVQVAASLEGEPEIRWPAEAEDELEERRRHIIERCLRIEPDERYVDLREVLEAFREIESERAYRTDIASLKTEQVQLTAKAKGAKLRAAVIGLSAAAAAGLAVFALADHFGWGKAAPQGDGSELAAPQAEAAPTPAKLEPTRDPESDPGDAMDDLRHSRAAVDAVFEMIAARDAEGNPLYGSSEGTLGTVLNYYDEFARRHADRPELADAVAQARNNSGELNLLLGDATAARANLIAAAEMYDKLETGGGEISDLLVRRAKVHSNLADAYTISGMPTAAIESAKAADAIFQQLSQRNPGSPAPNRMLAASSLALGRKLSDGNQPGEAGIYIEKAATLLRKLETDNVTNESDLALLAAASFERGRVERALGNREDAIKSQIDAVDRYLALVEARPEVAEYRYQLARCYGEAADLAAMLGEPGEAKTANQEAVELLGQLAEEASDRPAYRFELARRLRAGAAALRDFGSAGEARSEHEKAIVLLDDLVKTHPDVPDYAYELAILCGIHADLLAESKKNDDALQHGKRSVDLIQTLLNDDLDPENNDAKRPKYRHALAALYGKLGHHTELAGDKDSALHCFDKALKQYQTLAEADAADQTAAKGAAWAEDRISRLQKR